MFLHLNLPSRLASLVISAALVTVVTLSVCPMFGASSVKDAHRCCKTAGHSAPASDKDSCRTKCASSSPSAITPVGLIFAASLLDQIAPALTTAEAPKPAVEISSTPLVHAAGPPHAIYERNSVLLI